MNRHFAAAIVAAGVHVGAVEMPAVAGMKAGVLVGSVEVTAFAGIDARAAVVYFGSKDESPYEPYEHSVSLIVASHFVFSFSAPLCFCTRNERCQMKTIYHRQEQQSLVEGTLLLEQLHWHRLATNQMNESQRNTCC